jgi:hypothetical protein
MGTFTVIPLRPNATNRYPFKSFPSLKSCPCSVRASCYNRFSLGTCSPLVPLSHFVAHCTAREQVRNLIPMNSETRRRMDSSCIPAGEPHRDMERQLPTEADGFGLCFTVTRLPKPERQSVSNSTDGSSRNLDEMESFLLYNQYGVGSYRSTGRAKRSDLLRKDESEWTSCRLHVVGFTRPEHVRVTST